MQTLFITNDFYSKLKEDFSKKILNLYGYKDENDFLYKVIEVINRGENLNIEKYDVTEERKYGMYNGYIKGVEEYDDVTVSFSAIATKKGNTIINQQLLPMLKQKIDDNIEFLISPKIKKIFILSSSLNESSIAGGTETNRIKVDEVDSLTVQVKCLNTMGFNVYDLLKIENLNVNLKYNTLKEMEKEIDILNSKNSSNQQVKTITIEDDKNYIKLDSQEFKGNVSKFFAIRVYAALMLNKVYHYDFSNIQQSDEQIRVLKKFMEYINNRNFPEVSESIYSNKTNKLDKASNIILYGVPGCGKSYYIQSNFVDNDSFIERVVFYPDYTYSDFIGQIMPCIEKIEEENKLVYKFCPGPFSKILKKSIEDSNNNYYLIIEEINRGNAPSIFGEVFQLLDRNSEGQSIYSITNYDISNYIYGSEEEKIMIPKNLFILATMNTSDQNVFTLDTAFQRRWEMKHIPNDILNSKYANTMILDTNITWAEFALTINDKILELNDSIINNQDKRIGAYFIKEYDLKNCEKFSNKVIKYLWDDVFKYNREEIFNLNNKNRCLDEIINNFNVYTGNDRFNNVFKISFIEETTNE